MHAPSLAHAHFRHASCKPPLSWAICHIQKSLGERKRMSAEGCCRDNPGSTQIRFFKVKHWHTGTIYCKKKKKKKDPKSLHRWSSVVEDYCFIAREVSHLEAKAARASSKGPEVSWKQSPKWWSLLTHHIVRGCSVWHPEIAEDSSTVSISILSQANHQPESCLVTQGIHVRKGSMGPDVLRWVRVSRPQCGDTRWRFSLGSSFLEIRCPFGFSYPSRT